jgi:hypothetical protein
MKEVAYAERAVPHGLDESLDFSLDQKVPVASGKDFFAPWARKIIKIGYFPTNVTFVS